MALAHQVGSEDLAHQPTYRPGLAHDWFKYNGHFDVRSGPTSPMKAISKRIITFVDSYVDQL